MSTKVSGLIRKHLMCEMANDMKHESGRCIFEHTDVVCQRSGQEAMIMERDSVCEF